MFNLKDENILVKFHHFLVLTAERDCKFKFNYVLITKPYSKRSYFIFHAYISYR